MTVPVVIFFFAWATSKANDIPLTESSTLLQSSTVTSAVVSEQSSEVSSAVISEHGAVELDDVLHQAVGELDDSLHQGVGELGDHLHQAVGELGDHLHQAVGELGDHLHQAVGELGDHLHQVVAEFADDRLHQAVVTDEGMAEMSPAEYDRQRQAVTDESIGEPAEYDRQRQAVTDEGMNEMSSAEPDDGHVLAEHEASTEGMDEMSSVDMRRMSSVTQPGDGGVLAQLDEHLDDKAELDEHLDVNSTKAKKYPYYYSSGYGYYSPRRRYSYGGYGGYGGYGSYSGGYTYSTPRRRAPRRRSRQRRHMQTSTRHGRYRR